ncbi:Threonine dehydratase, mitochondrial [Grifola frondosa]|uniref:Threonine dehydratase n=1 Tax=Grifola frondosa TaxID=5627 RepID=A0A1C7M1R9_GRIFR|nr:Threonine dehydratase, mitochondrial [Grifola frondosa]
MGPPPSPKEPRRSGRRPAPSASTSKSPGGSPSSESAPKSKESSHRPSLSTSSNTNRSKRNKNEETDEPLEEVHKNGVNTMNGNGNTRSKRKGKDKEKVSLTVEIPGDENAPSVEVVGEDQADEVEEEEQGITRCICAISSNGGDDEFFAQCEICKAWQHGKCMGYPLAAAVPEHYFCEQCRPDLWPELLKKYAKRLRQSSAASHHGTIQGSASRSSRSHSPAVLMKPTKRRNTMNSRDAAYEESVQALLEATASEFAAANDPPPSASVANTANGDTNGHVEAEQEAEVVPNSRKKRKRTDDDAVAIKRTRSASTTSERPPPAVAVRDATPASVVNMKLAKPKFKMWHRLKATKLELLDRHAGRRTAVVPKRTLPTTTARGEPKQAVQAPILLRPRLPRVHTTTRMHTLVSQQPLFTSWNLPDYLAHLEPMLPTDVPKPLEVRGSGIDANGRESFERQTERGVKVKWPSKRMSVGDMNKRVRSLVEWVGREQALAMERSRRKDAVEKALKEAQDSLDSAVTEATHENGSLVTGTDSGSVTTSPVQEKGTLAVDGLSTIHPSTTASDSTMKMMEELMEELIRFQERFGPEPLSYPRLAQHYLLPSGTPDYLRLILSSKVYEILKETPLVFCPTLSARLGNQIWLKREDLQEVFSFKIRGAYNFMASLTEEERWKGVVTCSAGNHAQGVALSGSRLGVPCTIVMPKGTPSIKVRNVSRLGAKVVLFGQDFDEAKAECARLASAHGLVFVPPYDDPLVIAGQGTVAMEILKQTSDAENLDAIFASVGGGGLVAGICEYVKRIGGPKTKVIGVETIDGDAMERSLEAGERVTLKEVGPFSDGTAVKIVGSEPFRICQQLLDGIVKADTDEICAAIKDIFEETRSITEPAGALALAGLKRYIVNNKLIGAEKKFIAVISGANMNFDRLRFVAERAELGEGREALLSVEIPEQPGSFIRLHGIIHPRATTEFVYRYNNPKKAQIFLSLVLETTNRAKEVAELLSALEQEGMKGFDISDDEMAKTHARYMIGGCKDVANERLFRFEFPERPGALRKFLLGLHAGWNISLFHYRNHGADIGKVLAGIQVPPEDTSAFADYLKNLGYPYVEETDNEVYKRYLRG